MSGPPDSTDAFDDVDGIETAWRRERPDLDVGSVGVFTRIRRIARLLERHRTEVLAELGSDSTTLDLLSTLRRAGPPYRLTPTELAHRTLITTGGMSQRLAKAERAGWISRQPAADDARSNVVSLTPAGFDLVERLVEAVFRSEQRLLGSLTSAEQAELAGTLRRLLADVGAHIRTADRGA